ncbi:MAG: Hint domain-containing protein, partial [Proteobacteria bacterium]|nr:Hint domain-containing protein [Pseudomonadota bacterium]
GGFGGGGGGGGTHGRIGGAGGFGGGGGGGFFTGGRGGFGGGNGNGGNLAGAGANTGGGGGLGAGGDIFIQQGGSLIIEGSSALNQGNVAGGQGGTGSRGSHAQAGRAYGDAIFVQGNQSIVLAPSAGQDLSIGGVIADMTGSADQTGQTGTSNVVVTGGGRVFLRAANTFSGGVVIQQGTLSLVGSPNGAGSGVISFATGADGILAVTAGATAVPNEISGFDAGDKLDFTNIGFAAGQSYAVMHFGTLTYSGTSGSGSVLMSGISDTTQFVVSSDGAGGSYVELPSAQPPPCFVRGTRIQTPDGAVAVEELRVGDAVLTYDGAPALIIWTGHRSVDCTAHPRPDLVWPVRVRTGTFGRGLPRRDLWLSPDHCLYLEQVLIPVKCLIDGDAIAQVPLDAVTYFHIELPRHGVVLAEGLPAESYLDTDGRSNFTNGGGVIRLFPDFASLSDDAAFLWEALGYAPRRVIGTEVAKARQRVKGQQRRLPAQYVASRSV